MKKFILFGILFSIATLALTLTGISSDENPDVAPTVSIRSPKDGTVVIEDSLNVEVRFASKEKGEANVRYIRLELDGNEVAIYQNKANIKDGIHTFRLNITDLTLGEHTLQAFAYQAEVIAELEGKSPIITFTKSDTPIPSRIIKDPTANPDGIFVDEPTLVTITAEIAPDPDLIESEIAMQRLNELNQPTEFLGYLHDDGLEGDVIANDNIYTLELNFNETEPSEIKLRIFAEYITTPTTISSNIFTVDAITPISEEEFAIILEVEEAAKQEFERLKEYHSDDIARELTVNWLKRQYGVEDAGISSDNDTIWILFTSGLEGGITTHPPGTRGNPQTLSTDPPAIPETVNAIVLAPFFNEFTSQGGDESDYIAEKLTQLWSPVSTIKHSAVTVDLMKSLSQYAVVSITSHGSVNSKDQVQIFTGEKATLLNRLQHIFDLMAGHVRISIVDGYYMITPSFITHYGQSYPKSLIYVGACESLQNNTMSNAFLDKGAYTYFGFDKKVNSPFAYSIGTRLFDYLLEDRMTTGDTFIALGNKVDPEDPHAEFLMNGEDDLVLAELPIIEDESPTEEIADKKPTIQARIYSPSSIDIDLATIAMTLDGLAVTPTVTPETGGSDITVTYTPTYDLDSDEHTVVINAKDAIGLEANEKNWSFIIVSAPDEIIAGACRSLVKYEPTAGDCYVDGDLCGFHSMAEAYNYIVSLPVDHIWYAPHAVYILVKRTNGCFRVSYFCRGFLSAIRPGNNYRKIQLVIKFESYSGYLTPPLEIYSCYVSPDVWSPEVSESFPPWNASTSLKRSIPSSESMKEIIIDVTNWVNPDGLIQVMFQNPEKYGCPPDTLPVGYHSVLIRIKSSKFKIWYD